MYKGIFIEKVFMSATRSFSFESRDHALAKENSSSCELLLLLLLLDWSSFDAVVVIDEDVTLKPREMFFITSIEVAMRL